MYEFEFAQPQSLNEALALLENEDAQVLAGGQTLIPTLKQRLAMPSVLVSLSRIAELRFSEFSSGNLNLGAMSTHADIAALNHAFPALAALAGQIGDHAVRNRGTIGGSLANNDPAACYPAAALATGASIITNQQEIEADDFFLGMFTTALDEGEIITSVRFPVPDQAAYEKFAQPASRFALVGVFVARFGLDVRVAVTGASEDGVFRWQEAEEALSNDFSFQALADVELSEDGLISDIHATPAYRAHLARVMASWAVARA